MKITAVHIYERPLVLATPHRMASAVITNLDSLIVQLNTDAGMSGWGEVCLNPPTYQYLNAAGARESLKTLAPALIGLDPSHLLTLHHRMDAVMIENNFAKAAIDIAAHDVTGKHYGVRVADLLGGAVTENVPSYYSLSPDDPDVVAEKAAEAVTEGFPRLQLKIGGRPIELDIETAHKVWERVGSTGVRLAVDANRSLNSRDVLRLSRECIDVPFIIEQPCNTLDEIWGIRDRISHAIYLDELTKDITTVMSAAAKGLANGFGMKVTRIGGLRKMAMVRDICDAWMLPHTTDDSWGGDIIAAACAHAGSTVRPQLNEGVWIAEPYLGEHYDPQNGIKVRDGHIRLPKGPGLGLEIDATQFGEPVASFD